jgi:hypothetical protein
VCPAGVVAVAPEKVKKKKKTYKRSSNIDKRQMLIKIGCY